MMKTVIASMVLGMVLFGCGGGGGSSAPISATTSNSSSSTSISQNGYTTDTNGKIKTIALAGSAEGVAVSENTLFVAEGSDGVEIISIGYNDQLPSEFITKISGVNAKSVSLSADGNRLYIVNEQGFVNIYNISNLSSPAYERTTSQQEIKKEVITQDENYKFIPNNEKGLQIYDISNPANETLEVTFNKSEAYDIVLADKDTKALLAAGVSGINLLDITNITEPNLTANFTIGGVIKGLSLNSEEGLLFVANGDNGVMIYSLNVILDKLAIAQ